MATTEVHYALVLNGGVSLAVWMGGVTHELNNVRMASFEDDTTDPEVDVRRAWRAILDAVHRSVVVDLAAGTSAGGLNGTLLATAVARGADLPPMKAEWTTLASLDVDRLVRRDPHGATSMLDGTFFAENIARIVSSIGTKESSATPRDCTLLVTATALASSPIWVALPDGDGYYTRDGRRVYRFERRRGADDRGDCAEAVDHFEDSVTLAAAARASASFPLAFEPVFESDGLLARRHPESPAGPSWLVDGGVLDNAPFEPLLEAILAAPLTGPEERSLLYVTPGVNRHGSGSRHVGTSAPSLKRTMAGLVSASREPDERLDYDDLEARFEQMGFTVTQPATVLAAIATDLTAERADAVRALSDAAAATFALYRNGRAEALERGILAAAPDAILLAPPDPPRLSPDDIPGLPEQWPPQGSDPWAWGWATTDRVLRWFGRMLGEITREGTPNVVLTDAYLALSEAQVWVTAVSDCTAIPAPPRGCTDVVAKGIAALERSYAAGSPTMLQELSHRVVAAAEAISSATGVPSADLLTAAFAIEVVTSVSGWSGEDYSVPRFSYVRLTPATPLGRSFGPVTANDDWPERKLYGERWGHFGAFSAPGNRDHDWLWGRIDGANALADDLLDRVGGTYDASGRLLVSPARRERLVEDLLAAILRAEGATDESVERSATDVYNADAGSMYAAMMSGESGQDTVHGLFATGIALLDETGSGAVGTGVRVLTRMVFANDWSYSELPASWPRWVRWAMRPVRRFVVPSLRRALDRKLQLR